MKFTVWMASVLILFSGCATRSSVESLPSIKHPLPVVAKASNNVLDSAIATPFCCSLPQDLDIKLPEYGPKVNDLERFSQSIEPYLQDANLDREVYYDVQSTFEQNYFRPWSYTVVPTKVQDASWPLRAFRGGYGSNLRPIAPLWFNEMEIQSNFEAFGQLNQKAIALKWMNIRALPTDKPLYKNPSLPGEGYPFDLLQNSSLNYNEPVFISHTSKDGAWSYIFTNNASGWVHSENIAVLDEQKIAKIRSQKKVFLIEDNIPLYDEQNHFTIYSRVGMVLPLDTEDEDNYSVSVYESNTTLKHLIVPKKSARSGVSKFNKDDMTIIANQVLANTYGWGGMYGERDCSSMIRDMMTPFGIWLPRNSAAQAKRGEVITFDGLSNEEKVAVIKEKGIPFETIVYLKGHVLLYIGVYQDNVMVMHNIWGVRTLDKSGNKGRHIIGKAVISTLELGAEIDDFDQNNKLLSRVQSINIFTKSPSICAVRKKDKLVTINP